MPVRISLCDTCTYARPDIRSVLDTLCTEYGPETWVLDIHCIAACDGGPAVMIDHEYLPRVTPEELRQRLLAMLVVPGPGPAA